jgi:phage baseplate assembly protein W
MTSTPVLWSDIDPNFISDSQGDVKRVYNADAVKASVMNILLTRKGERVMNPEFGCGLQDFVFDALDKDFIDLVARQIKSDIRRFEDRASVDQINFVTDVDNDRVTIQLLYHVVGYFEVASIVLNFGGD